MRQHFLLWCSALLALPLACVRLVNPLELESPAILLPKDIFILAGQSNMAGRGGVIRSVWDGFVPPESQPKPSIVRLSPGLAWEQAHEPLHADIDVNRTCGVGPGMAFANAVIDEESSFFGVVGLVPCAVGGTRMRQWARGTWLYNELVRRAEVARQDGGTIRAILWFQGETDTVSREDSRLYKQRLEKFISDLRADLQSPVLPVFQVALGSGQGRFIETVRKAQLGINLENVITIDAMGLALEPDGLHLTTASEVEVGEMLAAAFLRTFPRSIHINTAARTVSYLIYEFCIDMIFGSMLLILTIHQLSLISR